MNLIVSWGRGEGGQRFILVETPRGTKSPRWEVSIMLLIAINAILCVISLHHSITARRARRMFYLFGHFRVHCEMQNERKPKRKTPCTCGENARHVG